MTIDSGLIAARAWRRRQRRHPAAAYEIGLVLAAWLLYFGVRAFTEGRTAAAFAHARAIVHLERSLGIYWEPDVQGFMLAHRAFLTFANWVYIWGHWPVIVTVAVVLYRRERATYRLLRNAMFISGAIGLVIFALYPVAPPRLAPLGLIDSVTAWSTSYRALQPPALTNPYAAMPSLHLGWNLLVGIVLMAHARPRVVRAFGAALPPLMALAVVVTANHFILDVVAGAALALFGLIAAAHLQRGTMRP